jgi:Fe-S oxidoreductase
MAKMKIEVLAAANKRRGLSLHDRLVAYLPRYAPYASRLAPLMNARNHVPGLAWLTEYLTGMSAKRQLPRWRRDFFRADLAAVAPLPLRGEGSGVGGRREGDGVRGSPPPLTPPRKGEGNTSAVGVERGEGAREVALFADTFNTYFEPENLHAAIAVLTQLGYRVALLRSDDGDGASAQKQSQGQRWSKLRPLCCGRTFLSAGLVDEARAEARRVLAAAASFLARGIPIVGLEPSCVLTLRDEFLSMLRGAETERLASHALLLEEFLAREAAAGRIAGPIGRQEGKVLLHGHCHQKAFGIMGSVGAALALVDGLEVATVESSCCGMAGAFGYDADTYAVSMAMGELTLLPAVRDAAPETVIAADGFSCRHQIQDGTGRQPRHVARILQQAMSGTAATTHSR